MNRPIALFFAVLLTCISLTSVGVAADLGQLRFRLAAERSGEPQLSLSDDRHGGGRFSSSFAWRDLQGLDPAILRGNGGPLRFALVREAGRLDCSGTSRNRTATGQCRFSATPAFADMLGRHGIRRPTQREAFGLTMVGASRALVEAIAAARYPAAGIEDLTGLAALDVTPGYIAELSARGYRPAELSDLIAFKALGVTAAYVDGLRQAGFGRLSGEEIVQFKALGVSPAYLASLRRVGYGHVSADEVVQLKALGITADYIAGFQRLGRGTMPVSKLIESKALGVEPREVGSLYRGDRVSIAADDLIALKVAGLLP